MPASMHFASKLQFSVAVHSGAHKPTLFASSTQCCVRLSRSGQSMSLLQGEQYSRRTHAVVVLPTVGLVVVTLGATLMVAQ